MPKVSIIITAYNEEDVIDEAVQSLLKQTYKDYELILVNNGSTDNTKKVLQRYKNKKIRVVNLKKNLGPGGGRNAGAKKARGKILVFIDADMVFNKDYIKKLTKPVLEGKHVGTCHDTELVKNINNVWARTWCLNRIPVAGEYTGVYRAILAKAFKKAGGFDTSKGYFDDGLVGVAPSKVVHAVCYHNNPETLSEAFHHSRWVGRSLLSLEGLRKKVFVLAALGTLGFIAFIALLFIAWIYSALIVLAGILVFFLFVAKRDFGRVFKEKRPEYLVTAPILWAVRFLGYGNGVLSNLVRS